MRSVCLLLILSAFGCVPRLPPVESVVLEENDAIGFPTGGFVVLTPVRWCERRYLLAPGEFAEFCNHINWGYEPDRGMWGRFLCFLRVVSFTEHECVLEPRPAPEYTPPQVGWKVYCDADGAAYAPR